MSKRVLVFIAALLLAALAGWLWLDGRFNHHAPPVAPPLHEEIDEASREALREVLRDAARAAENGQVEQDPAEEKGQVETDLEPAP